AGVPGGGVALRVRGRHLHGGGDQGARRGGRRLDGEDEVRRGTRRDVERRTRRPIWSSSGRRERIARAHLVDAQGRERRYAIHGGDGSRSGKRAAARVTRDRNSDIPRKRDGGIAVPVKRRDLDRGGQPRPGRRIGRL